MHNLDDTTFEEFNNLLSGDIKYVVEGSYNIEIKKLRDIELSNYNRWNKDLKLITLFGNDKGTMDWRISEYSDGSGSNTKIKVFKTEKEAIEYVEGFVNERDNVSDHHVKIASLYGFKINEDLIEKYKKDKTSKLKKSISTNEKSLKELKDRLKNMEDDLKDIS